MNPPIFVVDTHALVWFVKGRRSQLGVGSFLTMIHPCARIVLPSHSLREVEQKFTPKMSSNCVRVPPTALLRLVYKCSNVRIIPEGPAFLACEFRLRREKRANSLPAQDIPIAASVIIARQYYDGPVALITKDRALTRWARSVKIPVVWNQHPPELRRGVERLVRFD
jgi:hypothetical protein